jgi:hypothetical protein
MNIERGESGRPRVANDDYSTPRLNAAGLVLGLRKMELALPRFTLDICGGRGDLARVVMALEPHVDLKLSDIKPQTATAVMYATLASVDATILADLESMLRITKARAIVSNFPFKRGLYRKIFHNCLALLRRGDIETFTVMTRAERPFDCDVGWRETANEQLFHALIACPRRSWLWPQEPGQAPPKGSYGWAVYRSVSRGREAYEVITVTKAEATNALARVGIHPD